MRATMSFTGMRLFFDYVACDFLFTINFVCVVRDTLYVLPGDLRRGLLFYVPVGRPANPVQFHIGRLSVEGL